MTCLNDARPARRHVSVILRHRTFSRSSAFCGVRPQLWEAQVMTDNNTHHDTIRRKPLLDAAREEMVKFERKENEFRRKDREERAAQLHLPLDEIRIN